MAVERVPGVESADVSYEAGQAVVVFDSAVTSPDEFIAELERMTGFTAAVMTTPDTPSLDRSAERTDKP